MKLHISKNVNQVIYSLLACVMILAQNNVIAKTENTFQKKLSKIFQLAKKNSLIEAELSYYLYSSFSEKITVTSGKMLLKKPYFFRWDIIKPEKELQIYNGQTLWKFMPNLKHAQCIPLLPTKIYFLDFLNNLNNLEKNFSLTQSNSKTFYSVSREKYPQISTVKKSLNRDKIFLKLTPKKTQNKNDLVYFLVLDSKKGDINEVFISKRNGNQLLFIFSQAKSVKRLKDKNSFVFNPPKNIIIDKCK